MIATNIQPPPIRRCALEDLYFSWSTADGSQFVDVREHPEFTAEHIAGVHAAPLSALEQRLAGLERQRPTYVICGWGTRSREAAKRLALVGFTDLRVVEGGMKAWAAAELPVVRGANKVWSLERQVRFVAGLLSLASAVLAWLVHPAFILLAGFIGAGLMHAAITETCGMGLLLAKLPWNQASNRAYLAQPVSEP